MSIVPTDLPIMGSAPSRRRFLAMSGLTAATAMVAVACGSDSEGASAGSDGSSSADGVTTVAVQASWLLDTEFAPLYIADDKGYFADEGVKLDLIPGGPDIGAIEAIVGSGAADVGISTDIFSVTSAIADGSPFVALGAFYQTNLNGFISPKDAPIDEASKLAGKRLGASQGSQPKIEAILAQNDIDPTNYTFVPAGYGPDLVINGDVDAQGVFITDEVIAYRQETGEEPVLLKWEDIGLPSYTLVIFTTKDYLEANREALVGFMSAIHTGQFDNVADPELGPTLAVEKYGKDAGLDLDLEKLKNVEYLKYAENDFTEQNGDLALDVALMDSEIIPGMVAADLKVVPGAEVVDTTVVADATSAG
jgi:ABC-type nitrate/sulfonate/bicarbonate transport system substrate-binding protein